MGQIKPFFNIYGTLYATVILACRYAPREIVVSTRDFLLLTLLIRDTNYTSL